MSSPTTERWMSFQTRLESTELIEAEAVVVDYGACPELDWMPVHETTVYPEAVVAARGLMGRMMAVVRQEPPEPDFHVPCSL